MLYYRYFVYLVLLECVLVSSKNHATYTLRPRLSHVKRLSIPRNSLFWEVPHSILSNDGSHSDFGGEASDGGKPTDDSDSEKSPERNDEYFKGENNQFRDRYDKGFLDESSSAPTDNSQDQGGYNYQYDNDLSYQQQPPKSDGNYSVNSSRTVEETEKNKQIVNDIAKEEQMKDMNNNAGNMLNSAKEAKDKADELLKQYKEGSYTSEANKHTLPKDEAGNIIITNTTTTPTPKHEEHKVDPLKSIRDATLSLFERAKQKNLPVSDPGELNSPEQVYAALNSLEYIIDGYRYTKIDLKEKSHDSGSITRSNKSEGDNDSQGEYNRQVYDEDNSESNDEDDETIMDPDRFLQVKKHEDDEEDEEGEDEMNDEEGEGDESEANEDEGEDFHKEDSEEGDGSKGPNTVSPHKAMEDLKGVLSKLTEVLDQVVKDNTGVSNVIMKEHS